MADEFDPIPPRPPGGSQPDRPVWAAPTGVIPGVVLGGRYRIEEFIGKGNAADVYRGLDELLARAVAIKVYDRGVTDPNNVAVLRTDLQILAKLHHPNLVTVFDARFAPDPVTDAEQQSGIDADLTYLVLELVDGGTLADRITPAGLPAVQVAQVGAAIAGALSAIHQFGLNHRNVKPSNILVSITGDVKLSDVGLARVLDTARLPETTGTIDDAAYLSPEQARGGEVGPSTDVYALGLVLLECLTGRREYPGQAQDSANARLQRGPFVPDSLPGSWPALLRAMTATDPARRPTAAQVETAAARLAAPTPEPPPVPAAPAPVWHPPVEQDKPQASFGRIVGVVLLVLALTAGLIIGVVAVIRNNEGNDSPNVTTLTVSRTTAPTSVVTTTERTTETSREIIAPTVPARPTAPTSEPTTPTSEPTTPTTSTTSTTPTTSAESAGRNQGSETTTP